MITTINEFRKQNENFNLDDRAKLEFVMSIATPEQREVLTNFQAGTEQFFLQLLKGSVSVQLIDDTLQLMVNDVEGDESQLEPEHAAYAKTKGWFDAFNENIKTINEDESNPNYMVLGNISKMSRMLAEMTSLLGTENLDEWAKDHIATSADDIEEVYNFLKSKKESVNIQSPNVISDGSAICWEPQHVTENNKPKIFTYTAYRLPTESEMIEINACNLNAKSIYDGYSYIIVGRGIMSQENKQKIYNGIKALSEMFPENAEYSKALDMVKNIKGRF